MNKKKADKVLIKLELANIKMEIMIKELRLILKQMDK